MIKLKDILAEKYEIDLEVGDTILRGKFKNKSVVVKSFGTDDKGQPTINGKKMLSFRIKKLMPKKEASINEGFDKQAVVDRVYPQIVKNLGRARRGVPKVEFHTNIYVRVTGIPGSQGEANPHAEYNWEANEIYLYTPKMKNEKEIIKALLHEYTHATQDHRKHAENRKLGYKKDPDEIAARKAEKNWKKYL